MVETRTSKQGSFPLRRRPLSALLFLSTILVVIGWHFAGLRIERRAVLRLFPSASEVFRRIDGHVVHIRLTGMVSNDDLTYVARFSKLHTLDLAASKTVDFKRVPIKNNQITDAGLCILQE